MHGWCRWKKERKNQLYFISGSHCSQKMYQWVKPQRMDDLQDWVCFVFIHWGYCIFIEFKKRITMQLHILSCSSGETFAPSLFANTWTKGEKWHKRLTKLMWNHLLRGLEQQDRKQKKGTTFAVVMNNQFQFPCWSDFLLMFTATHTAPDILWCCVKKVFPSNLFRSLFCIQPSSQNLHDCVRQKLQDLVAVMATSVLNANYNKNIQKQEREVACLRRNNASSKLTTCLSDKLELGVSRELWKWLFRNVSAIMYVNPRRFVLIETYSRHTFFTRWIRNQCS